MVGGELSAFGKQLERAVTLLPGDNCVAAARGLTDIERREQPGRRGGCREFLDAAIAGGLADVAFRRVEPVERNGNHGNTSLI